MRDIRIAVFALLAAGACALPTSAQEFSATGVGRDTSGHVVKSKIYMRAGKVRIDPQEVVSDNEQPYIVLDLTQRTSTALNSGQKTYSIQSGPEAQKNLQFYSGASPCPPAGATCSDAGTEALNGRSAERWEITRSMQGQTLLTRVWVDAKLHVWTKVEVLTGATLVAGTELQDIREGPQVASLFVIPAGFRVITPPKRGG
jgi:hypothetical protein